MKYLWMMSLVALLFPVCSFAEPVAGNVPFDALVNYVYGQDRAPLHEIKHLVNQTYGDKAARFDLEKQLIAIIESDSATPDAKAFPVKY